MFDINYLGHNFNIKLQNKQYPDDFICSICKIRIDYINNTYNEVSDTVFISVDEILTCEEKQIKNLLE